MPIIRSTIVLAIFSAALLLQTAPALSEVKAAITQQVNELNKKNPEMVDSRIEITTIVKHPERIKVLGLKTPTGIKMKSKSTKDCGGNIAVGSNCKQRHNFLLDANKQCRLDGKYAMKIMISCAKGAPKGACKPRKA